MKYFLDTEFIEFPNQIHLISIGIKCEDGRKYYAISSEFDSSLADDWVKTNVISKLEDIPRKNIKEIKKEIINFVGNDKNPEFWAYYADYDWVVFCWIFGRMIDLPEHFPMYCRDLKQLMDFIGKDKIPNPNNEHNALADAEWNEQLYNHLMK